MPQLGAAAAAMRPEVTSWRLPNGLTVVAETMPSVRSVAVGLWMAAGSRHEPEKLAGVSHFIEHLLFKGTAKRTAREIAEVMDEVGGQLNAFTTKEYTCFHARVLDTHISLAIDVLADMVCNSLLQPDDFEHEKDVVLEEIGMYEDTPDELVHDLFAQALWADHPLGRSVLGQPAGIRGLQRGTVSEYLATTYIPSRTVLAVAGSFDLALLASLCEEHFGSWTGSGPELGFQRPSCQVSTLLRAKDTELIHVCLGGEGLALSDPALYALSIMSNILGGGPSSRLFQAVREERGLAYSVFAYTASFRDNGVFAVYCGSGPERIRPAITIVGEELRRLADAGVTAPELYRAKEQLKSNITMALESTSARMNRIGRAQLLLGEIAPIDEVLGRIEAVSIGDIRSLAGRFCDPRSLSLAAIGPDPHGLDLRGAFAPGGF